MNNRLIKDFFFNFCIALDEFPFISDRGSILVGKRADLVLVDGDPTNNISVCRNIKQVWVKGVKAAE